MPRSSDKTGQQSGRVLIRERDVDDDDAHIIGWDGTHNNELEDKYEDEYQDSI